MKPERYQQVSQLYHAALELETDERASFLDGACGDDDELRREVESLLLAHEQADGVIAGKLVGVVAEMAAQQQNPSLARLVEALDVARQVASALAAAHEAGIIHRDISRFALDRQFTALFAQPTRGSIA